MTTSDFERHAFAETARRFARGEIAPMVGTEGRDGNLERLADVLAAAEEAGLLASPKADSPGHEYGVWGRNTLTDGAGTSVAVLREVAAQCAGVAGCLHFAGLGALEAAEAPDDMQRVAVAFFEDGWRLSWPALHSPPSDTTRIEEQEGRPTVSGAKGLVHEPPGCQGYVVFAALDGQWHRALVSSDADGLTRVDPGQRTGLAALEARFLSLDRATCRVAVADEPTDPRALLRRHLLGLSAIALGNAEGALSAATAYACERYQGGGVIVSHPAVQLLLGDASSRIGACAAHLQQAAHDDEASDAALARAIACRLRVTTSACQAVTDCLQVLGGYGYMEDYRLEKRLRDAVTIKSMAPRPDDLRLLLAGALREVGS